MSRTMERRLSVIETKRRQTDLTSLSDEELQRRIHDLDAILLQHYTPDELRAEMRAIGCGEALLDLMSTTREDRTHAPH